MDYSFRGAVPAFPVALLFLIVVSGLCGCQSGGGADAFSIPVYTPSDACGFEILGAPGSESVLIRSEAPWQGAGESDSRELLILRDGETAPAGFKGQILKGEAGRVVCMSAGHIAGISLMGETERIVGASGLNYISSEEIAGKRNEIAEVGFEGAIDYESLLAAKPDLVILYGVNAANPMEAKLQELSIPYVYIGDYLEQSPLGKAEWMVAIGECLGKREEAIGAFLPIKERYGAMKSRLKPTEGKTRPKVMLNGPYGDQWMVPGNDSYMARLVADAGGDYLFSEIEGNESIAVSMEEILQKMSEADRWINVGDAFPSSDDIRSRLPLLASSDVVRKGEIFNNTLRSTPGGGNDFYESGIVNPDLILRDLIKIMHPELVSETFFYYMKLE